MLKKWKKINQIKEISNKWWTYIIDEVELPDGKMGEYHYVHTNGSSMIIPVLDNGNILMVNQYRYLKARESLEFPCGSVKDGSTYEETATHELAEEANVEAEVIEYAGTFNPYNGVTDEMCQVYIARNLKKKVLPPDETEEFEIFAFRKDEIDSKIQSGEIWDGMSIAAWMLVRNKI
ncbi:MAG: ADP-ribose pyrophosphatase [Ignavibacteriae bacterium]|nr:MAG: ADP-ribose pyrophosphatase [Ignavibacteriota bacterium]